MKKLLFILMAACGLGLLGCGNSQPKAVYDQQSERWVLQTDTETLYGAGTEYIMFVPAAFDNIKLIDRDGEEGYYLATRKGKTYMFGEYGGILCDSIPLVSEPVYRYARGKNGSFSGSLAGLPANPITVHTEKGAFLVINKNEWICYGPYEDIVTGNTGLMFKENGKWGVRKYGNWIEKKQASYTDAKDYRFEYQEIILLPAKYEKVINYAYTEGAYDEKRGFKNESDVKWYAFDGTKWHAFDVNGKPIKVNQSELNTALKLKPQIKLGKPLLQRIGNDEASIVRVQRRRF